MKKFLLIFLSCLSLMLLSRETFSASGDILTPSRPTRVFIHNGTPRTYIRISDEYGSQLYKYRTERTYVYMLDLDRVTLGSSLEFSGNDFFSNEPLYSRRTLIEHVRSIYSQKPISVFNGQFFDPKRESSPLSFGLKEDGIPLTKGADDRGEKKNMLIVNASGAEIVPYTEERFATIDDTFVMVNLDPSILHYADESIGRTYVCIPQSEPAVSKKLLIFVTEHLTHAESLAELRYWGCDPRRISMLDSSGSSQFWSRSATVYGFAHQGKPDYRRFPHAVGVFPKNGK